MLAINKEHAEVFLFATESETCTTYVVRLFFFIERTPRLKPL